MANSGLGRGLNSLIPNKKDNSKPLITGATDTTLKVDINKIATNPHQPRKRFTDSQLAELADSIREHGIIQPLVVTLKGDKYELIAGERRFRAAKQVGLKKVPVVVRKAGEQEKLEIALIENIQRENLNPIDMAHAYHRLVDEFNLTQTELSKRLGKPRSSITNTMRMIRLPQEIQLALMEGKISEGHGKYLLGLESESKQMALFRRIIRNNLSITDTNKEVRRMGGTKAMRIKINYADKDKEFAFREFFAAKTEIRRHGKGGQVIISFTSDEELNGFVEKLKK